MIIEVLNLFEEHLKNLPLSTTTMLVQTTPIWMAMVVYFFKDEKPDKYDEVFNIDNKHNLYICGKSLMYLIGTEITWEKNFMGEGFKFTNPNASGSCGCGETFSI